MKKYRLLQNTPEWKIGTVIEDQDVVFQFTNPKTGAFKPYSLHEFNGMFFKAYKENIDWFEEIKEEKKFGEIERVGGRSSFFYITSQMETSDRVDGRDLSDNLHYESGNYFLDGDEAQERADWIKAALKIWRWVDDANDGWECSWDGVYRPYYVYYGHNQKQLFVTSFGTWDQISPFILKSKELAEQLIKELEPELKIFFRVK